MYKKILILFLLILISCLYHLLSNKTFFSNTYINKTVKILAQDISFDWKYPYKHKNITKAIGSGFFINDDGMILTCSHVVENSKKVYIEIPEEGDNKIEVEIIKICPDLDLAILKTINYKNKDFFKLYESDKVYSLNGGEEVYAIGFPLAKDNIKITKGILSGRDHSLFETDTSLNGGNSGGPLIYKNKVIGINNAGIIENNIGYAIPISCYHLIKDEITKHKHTKLIKRPGLNIFYSNTNPLLLNNFKSKCNDGVYINKIFNSPLLDGGLKEGDILCSINNIKINNRGLLNKKWFNEKMKLHDIINTIKNDEIINIQYSRNNNLYNKTTKYTTIDNEIRNKYPIFEKINYEVFGGLIITELSTNYLNTLTPKLNSAYLTNKKTLLNVMKYYNKEFQKESRIIITKIYPNTTVSNMEILNENDIIEEVNNIKVNTIQSFREAINKNKNNSIIIKTEINTIHMFNKNDLLKEDIELSKIYKYPLSTIHDTL